MVGGRSFQQKYIYIYLLITKNIPIYLKWIQFIVFHFFFFFFSLFFVCFYPRPSKTCPNWWIHNSNITLRLWLNLLLVCTDQISWRLCLHCASEHVRLVQCVHLNIQLTSRISICTGSCMKVCPVVLDWPTLKDKLCFIMKQNLSGRHYHLWHSSKMRLCLGKIPFLNWNDVIIETYFINGDILYVVFTIVLHNFLI